MQITPQEFINQGIKVIISDLDNTLVPWNKPARNDQTLTQWIQALQAQNIQVIIASNNSQQRVRQAVAGLPVTIIARTCKPLPFVLRKYLRRQRLNKDEVVMVGDQLLTDILAGNLAGLKTILVRPLVATDAKKTRVNRFFERPLMQLNHWLNPQLKWRKHFDE